ncbi:MAG: tRNA (adenosine(37)-N6)-threonylcarbamoyltransferase complex dimerization subunit type 1 TsaB [Candidatus Omnitrophica bacterium]|nr:tRNA (adenosine(37)-N6)-threonylcarbamoyltransferase complex dimerization subunit type 1 TsaB [Candidatus Omnitrophota bacterium]
MLALETATQFAGVGIVGAAENTEFIISSREKGEGIMVFIDRALKELNLELKDIDMLAVGIGPGFYTGVRIGLSIMKGLAMAAKKPLVGISTLDTIACNFSGRREKIVTLLNAYGGEVYGAVYQPPKRCGNYFIGPIEDFVAPRKWDGNSKVIFAGTGIEIYRKKIEEILGKRAIFSFQKNWIPHPVSLAKLAMERFKRGRLLNPDRILPLYLKKFPSHH